MGLDAFGLAMKWGRHMHKHPCSETDRIDAVLNELEESTITLSAAAIDKAIHYGKRRQRESAKLNDKKVSGRDGNHVHIVGVLGEMAVCKYLGWPYEFRINTFRQADVGDNIEVRSRTVLTYDCKVRPDDQDDFFVVMALIPDIRAPIRMAGWIKACDGKTYPLRDPVGVGRPFHFVPQSALNPMSELKKLLTTLA